MAEREKEGRGEKTVVRGLCFIGIPADANSVQVECDDGKIVRIRPLHYDWKYPGIEPWKIEARGKTFSPSMESLIPPFSLGYKNRVYSPNRVLYPLKRVDWDPNGERNPQNRGSSKYERISWDEALDIVVSEIKRVKEKYGMEAILSQSDGHGETAVIHAAHGCHRRLLRLLGGYTLQTRNTDSWEGWYWGAKHVWGCESLGQMVPVSNVMWDVSKNTDGILFWGCDPETTPWGFNGQLASRLSYWFTDLGIKSIYVAPDLNYGAAVHADKWIPVLPNTDAALYLAIANVWMNEGTYDKEYVKTHSVGFDKFQDYVLGEEDGVPKTPQWAAPITGVPSYTIKALARYWGKKTVSIAIGNGGPGIRGPYATEPARLQVLLLAMQGVGKPGVHQFKMIEWGLYNKKSNFPLPTPKYIPLGVRCPPRMGVHRHSAPVHPQGSDPRRHPGCADQLVRHHALARLRRSAVHQVHLPTRGRDRAPYDLDRLALVDDLLERHQLLRSGSSRSQDRVRPGSAPLDGERLHAGRPRAAVADGHGGQGHRRGVAERPVQLPLLRGPGHSSPGANRRATTR